MPKDLVHFLETAARPLAIRGNDAGPLPANSNPSVRELLSRNGELAVQNRQLRVACKRPVWLPCLV